MGTLVSGVVVRGYQCASGTAGNYGGKGSIEQQKPAFKELGFDIDHCFNGTLNVDVSPYIKRVLMTEPTLRNVLWGADYRPEDFFLSPCRLTFGGVTYEGWVYYPDPSKKKRKQPDSVFELLFPPIPGIAYGDMVQLELDPQEVRIETLET